MGPEILIFLLVAGLIIAAVIAGSVAARKRQEALAALAQRLGLEFDPGKERSLPSQFDFLDRLDRGSNRYASNRLSGTYGGYQVMVFDYHYETHSQDSKGRTQTQHHHFSFFMLFLPRSFPELTIVRESWGSKLAQAFGYEDIDFESAEFSRRFCVRSKDRRFAYDICHPRMMDYLLANEDLSLEIEDTVLAIGFPNCLAPEAIESNLERLRALRELFPPYLFNP